MRSAPNRKNLNKKLITAVILAAVFLLVVGGIVAKDRYYNQEDRDGTSSSTEGLEGVDLSPPSKEEQQAIDQHKSEVEKQQQHDSQTSEGGIKTVTPIITNAGFYNGQVEVRGYISGIYEEGGTCSVTISKGDSKLTKSGKSTKGATTTDCPVITFSRSELSGQGTWTAAISYSSTAAKGTSEPRNFEVNE